MSDDLVRLDVRPDIQAGREPFSRIMQTAAGLGADQALLLTAPFEPTPLYGILGQKGFKHAARPIGNGDWEILFSHGGVPADEAPLAAPAAPVKSDELPGAIIDLDARGLEPPQPMIAILEALTTLPEGTQLRARTDRRPMHLYGRLQERGYVGQTEAHSDGSFSTLIRRA